VSETGAILRLHDLHLLEDELADPVARARLRRLGLAIEAVPALERARERSVAVIERRWMILYERARSRYGRGLCAVRERVCQGCHITLPTAVSNPAGALRLCESCGRLLYWA
jgi:predicted  nucleic acid-binding Zn-ribbon protein